MKIGRRGKDAAVRIPATVVRELDLAAGDEIELLPLGDSQFGVRRVLPDDDEELRDLIRARSDEVAQPIRLSDL